MNAFASADQAKESSAKRLRLALADMAEDPAPPTASRLCQIARISRNALYRYHPDILHELRKLQHQRYRKPAPRTARVDKLQSDNDALKIQLAQLASLVDHYFSAWQEASTALKRRENELSELRKANKAKVIAISK